MTAPTITYGSRFISDCTAATEVWEGSSGVWTETEDGNTCALTTLHGDVFNLAVTVSAGNKIAYYSYPNEAGTDPLVDLNISRILYPTITFHYKTTANIKAKIDVIYDDPATQTVLAETSNTDWTYGTVALTGGTNIDHIRLYANGATGTVNYDFVMIHEGTFTFPFVPAGGVHYETPYKNVELDIPGRDGGINQKLGMKSPLVWLEGKMDYSATGARWKTAPSSLSTAARSLYGNRFYSIVRGMIGGYREPFQWFTSDKVNCKVIPDNNPFRTATDPEGKDEGGTYSLHFKQHSLSSLGEAIWDGLGWAR